MQSGRNLSGLLLSSSLKWLSDPRRLRQHLLTYLLTAWRSVLIEKLTGLQLVKKFPAFYGTRMFITALTSLRHLSLSWASTIQPIYPHLTSWRSILIISTNLDTAFRNVGSTPSRRQQVLSTVTAPPTGVSYRLLNI